MLQQIIEMIISLFINSEKREGKKLVKEKEGLVEGKYSKVYVKPVAENVIKIPTEVNKGYKFSKTSLRKLATCHKDLQKLMYEVIKYVDISILCGYRSEEEQNEAYKKGFSKLKYPKSKHNSRPSFAVDIAPYKEGVGIDWEDIQAFKDLAAIVKREAEKLNIAIKWGGDYKSFIDMPHWELRDK